MKILCVGGGPAGLYFSILLKRQDPRHQITVIERNPAGVTFGWGVVFSDETLGNLLSADPETHTRLSPAFARWDDIDIHRGGEVIRSTGHGFSGIARVHLLRVLQARAAELGVELIFNREVRGEEELRGYDLVVGADGVRSTVRQLRESAFQTHLDVRKCKYIWLGTRQRFDAFTFLFEQTEHGMFQVHAYRFDEENSTFIVECNADAWQRAGFDRKSPEEAVADLEKIFAKYLGGHPLLLNKSTWIQFVTVRNATWSDGHVVLLGDAAHTAHFSIGSGTKLAIEDAIALATAFSKHATVPEALAAYEAERRITAEKVQKAAEDSLRWFESVPRYERLDNLTFAFSLLTRSLRITYENLRLRDPALVTRMAEHVHAQCQALPEAERARRPSRPPMFTPFRLRELTLDNRVVVSPMCMYSATDGLVNDFHLAHLGRLALGGAGLVMTEMTDVSPEGRITPGCAGMWSEAHATAWKRIVDFAHQHSSARMGLQLGHAGRKGSTELPWVGGGETTPLAKGSWPTLAPSAVPHVATMPAPKEMTRADMEQVRDQFVASARWGQSAGFDLLELHFAHGYLLSSFLTPLSNRRRDAYGGPLENRLRFPLEVAAAVRAVWPAAKPLSVRISATDWVEGGNEGEDAVVIAQGLKAQGVDIVHVSTGFTSAEQKPVFGRMWQTRFADQVRNEAQVPTIAVGNITSADQVNSIIASGRADLVALARPHLTDPSWTQRAAAEQGYALPFWPPPYITARPRLPTGR